MNRLSPKELDLLQRIEKSPDLQPLFFKKVKGLKWFDELSTRGYFQPQHNPRPVPAREEGYVRIPHWPPLDYLVKTAPEVSDHPAYAKNFFDIVTAVTDYTVQSNYSNHQTWWSFAKIVARLPFDVIDPDDLRIVDLWLDDKLGRSLVADELGDKWLPRLLMGPTAHAHQLAARLISHLFKVTFFEEDIAGRTTRNASLRIDQHHAKEITAASARLAGTVLKREGVSIFDAQLRAVVDELQNDRFSSLWQPAIEDHEQNEYRDNAENILVKAYRESLDGYIDVAVDGVQEYIGEMLSSAHQIIERLAIHAVQSHFRVCREWLDALLHNRYFEDAYRHEMWMLLRSRYPHFATGEKRRVLELVSALKRTDDSGAEHSTATAYLRASWLAAIKDYGSEEARLYTDSTEIAGIEPDHPSFTSYMSSGWVGHKAPIPLEHLQSLDLDALLEILNTYSKKAYSFFEPGIEGLSRAFGQLIKTSPLNYYTHLDAFVGTDPAYIHQIIEAYRELWTEKAKLPWSAVWPALLSFCRAVIEHDSFFSTNHDEPREAFVANRNWIVSSIGRLIESGTQSDDHAFDAELLMLAEGILLHLLARVEEAEVREDSDAVSIAINSPRGHCLEALINLSLRCCRIADASGNGHADTWLHFEATYDSELDRKTGYEFVALVTNYLSNFLYMSNAWVLSRFDRIFDKTKHIRWLCAIQGYGYVGRVYQTVFGRLKSGGHLLPALDDKNLDRRTKDRLVEHIAVAYLSGFETFAEDDSVIRALIERRSYDDLTHLIWFIWTQKDKEKDGVDARAKVYELWPRIVEVVDENTFEGQKILSHLGQWAHYVHTIDEGKRPPATPVRAI